MARRRQFGGIAFMVVWMVIWTAAIFVAIYLLGARALAGDVGAALFLAVWIAAALFGLRNAARTLLRLLAGRTGPARSDDPRHHWDDGIDRPPPPPAT